MLLLLDRDAEAFQVATVLPQFRLKLCNFDIFLHILLKQLCLLLLGLLSPRAFLTEHGRQLGLFVRQQGITWSNGVWLTSGKRAGKRPLRIVRRIVLSLTPQSRAASKILTCSMLIPSFLDSVQTEIHDPENCHNVAIRTRSICGLWTVERFSQIGE
jgi:hypothetical protein